MPCPSYNANEVKGHTPVLYHTHACNTLERFLFGTLLCTPCVFFFFTLLLLPLDTIMLFVIVPILPLASRTTIRYLFAPSTLG